MKLDEIIETYHRDGVCLIPGAYKPEDINAMRALAWRAYRSAGTDQIQWRGVYPALLFWPVGLDAYTRMKPLTTIAHAILGPKITQLNKQIYFRLPGDGDQFAWHQDISFRQPEENYVGIEDGYLQTAIIIDDMDAENGAIEYVKGSHKKGNLNLIPRDGTERGLRSYDRDSFVGEPVTAKSGDLLIWSVMIVHGSQPNRSTRSRMYYMNGLARSECVLTNEFPRWD